MIHIYILIWFASNRQAVVLNEYKTVDDCNIAMHDVQNTKAVLHGALDKHIRASSLSCIKVMGYKNDK